MHGAWGGAWIIEGMSGVHGGRARGHGMGHKRIFRDRHIAAVHARNVATSPRSGAKLQEMCKANQDNVIRTNTSLRDATLANISCNDPVKTADAQRPEWVLC